MVRRKLEIKKIQDKSKRQVTFTKRRQGLFRKANSLCEKCDAQIAVITFSLAGNLYAWGHPRVDSILKRYMDYTAQETDGNHQENKGAPDDKDDKDHKNNHDMNLALSLSLPAEDHKNNHDMNLALSLSLPAAEDANEKSEEKNADHIHEGDLDLDLNKNKKRGAGHAAVKSKMMMALWDLAKFDGLQIKELEQIIVEIEQMKKKVVDRVNHIRVSAQFPTSKSA